MSDELLPCEKRIYLSVTRDSNARRLFIYGKKIIVKLFLIKKCIINMVNVSNFSFINT